MHTLPVRLLTKLPRETEERGEKWAVGVYSSTRVPWYSLFNYSITKLTLVLRNYHQSVHQNVRVNKLLNSRKNIECGYVFTRALPVRPSWFHEVSPSPRKRARVRNQNGICLLTKGPSIKNYIGKRARVWGYGYAQKKRMTCCFVDFNVRHAALTPATFHYSNLSATQHTQQRTAKVRMHYVIVACNAHLQQRNSAPWGRRVLLQSARNLYRVSSLAAHVTAP